MVGQVFPFAGAPKAIAAGPNKKQSIGVGIKVKAAPAGITIITHFRNRELDCIFLERDEIVALVRFAEQHGFFSLMEGKA